MCDVTLLRVADCRDDGGDDRGGDDGDDVYSASI